MSADLREWIDFAVENGHHSNAYDISRLFLVPLNGSALLDPNATSVELDWQLRDMLAISRQNSKLAAEGKLQPFDDPMDGAVLIAYQLDRIQLRYEAYASAVDATNAVLGFGFLPMMKVGWRSRHSLQATGLVPRLFHHVSRLRQSNVDIRHSLPIIKQVIQNHHLIIGRNVLLCDEQKDRMQGWKQNLNLISRGWDQLIHQVHNIENESLRVSLNLDKLSVRLLKMLLKTRDIKVKLKKLRILHTGHKIPAMAEAQELRNFLHLYHTGRTGVREALAVLRKIYQVAARKNKPYASEAHAMDRIAEDHVETELSRDIMLLGRCIFFIQVARVGRTHNYQRWSTSSPKPVLPDYVKKAVERHREKYGSQSIY